MKIKARYKLSNKLPVVIADLGSTEAVTVLVLAHVGSRQERPSETGLSHFLEHMAFKGTTSWPTAQALSQLVDSLGADYNAYTGKEITGFYVKAAAEHLETILQVLSEMVWQPKLDPTEVTREREVIVQEINMYEDNPMMYVGDLLEGELFRGHQLGWLISGSRQSVRRIRSPQLARHLARFYHPRNMLLVVAGRSGRRTGAMIERYFGLHRPAGEQPSFKRLGRSAARPRVVLKHKETEQVQLAFGLPAYQLRHRRTLALELLAVILGGNMSSRLFSRLREREGLCYSIRAGLAAYEGAGVLSVQAGLDRNRLPRAVALIREELERLRRELVPAAELSKAKRFLRGKMLLGVEDSAGVADWVGRQVMLEHKLELPAQFFQRLARLNARELQQVARALIQPSRYTLAVIGPFRDPKPFYRWLA